MSLYDDIINIFNYYSHYFNYTLKSIFNFQMLAYWCEMGTFQSRYNKLNLVGWNIRLLGELIALDKIKFWYPFVPVETSTKLLFPQNKT